MEVYPEETKKVWQVYQWGYMESGRVDTPTHLLSETNAGKNKISIVYNITSIGLNDVS